MKQTILLNGETSGNVPLLIKGQGVFIFSTESVETCSFNFQDETGENGITFEFSPKHIHAAQFSQNKSKNLKCKDCKSGLSKKAGAYYWVSLDSKNQRLYAGIGEPRLETMVFQYEYTSEDKKRDKIKKFLESLSEICVLEASKTIITPLKLLRDPITHKIPIIVKETDSLSMGDIASCKYLPKATLPLISQKLHQCISGKKFTLDDDDFPEFTKAIEHSIATPGMWCHETLKKKSTEFNKKKPNLAETYLRITLGQNNGESPGVPYVMEIWPVGHYSPVHNHGDSHAIIRVLHGKINVKLFPFLCSDPKGVEPFSTVTVNKDDVTWISPTLNQVHQLHNLEENTETCITIQCYMYGDENKTHYDYFDYLDNKGKIKQFEPDSDMDFIQFRELIKKERG